MNVRLGLERISLFVFGGLASLGIFATLVGFWNIIFEGSTFSTDIFIPTIFSIFCIIFHLAVRWILNGFYQNK